MGKSLIITEKPSVAREFAAVLHVNGRQDGYIENSDYVITWCVGHLVGMVYPEEYDMKYKKWKLEDLPFLPKDYKYDVIKNVAKQYEIVHGMLNREDIERVYWAGDAGKEGQTIEENIRNFGGVREGMEELRVWIDSQTEEEILRGIKEAKPMSDYANLGKSGIMRTIEDYAMGINFSRVMSIKYGNLLNNAAGTTTYTAIAVGRVMTCVLGMVVIREREIRNFVETPFYRVLGSFTDAKVSGEWKAIEGSRFFESPLLYKENGLKKEEDAKALIDSLQGKPAIVDSIEKTTSRKKAPLLFNLAELQAECSKRFKISPAQTLDVAQALYEKKLTTYPRTDARVLSTAIAGEIGKNISRLKGYEPTSAFCDKILQDGLHKNIAKTQYTDDSKVTDHYAIIPTGQLSELKSLDDLQRKVFDMIVRRFLSIFYPAAEYQNVKLTVKVDTESFFTSAKVLKTPGYLEIAGIPKKKQSMRDGNERIMGAYSEESKSGENGDEEEETADPAVLLQLADSLKKGDTVSANGYTVGFGKTSPPKRYTTGSMILAMENAGQLIEDEELRAQIKGSGIGTSATRAEIIEKLVRNKYLNQNNKTQILTPESLGEMIYEVVNMTVPSMLNPKMTASWEKGLDGITKGEVDFWDYRTKLETFIRTETEKMIGQDISAPLKERISYFAVNGRKNLGIKCPLCDGEVVTTPFGYGCSTYKKDDPASCKFRIGEIAGVRLTEDQAKKLITEGKTDQIRGFKSKVGKKFNAALKLTVNRENADGFEKTDANPFDGTLEENANKREAPDDRPYRIDFEFEQTEPEILPEEIKCPWCGKPIRKSSFGYGCTGFSKENPESCRFFVGQIAGKSLTTDQVKQLLVDGKTETISGFKSKSGKKFDAVLTLKADESGKKQVVFDFDNVEVKYLEGVTCPQCGGKIQKTSFGYRCEKYVRGDETSCNFSIGQIAGKNLTDANVLQLLTDKKTETIRGFKGKSGKKFDACLALKTDEEGKVQVAFDFEHVEAKVVKDVKCPMCGGEIAVTPFGFGCKNYVKDDPNSCRFSIGKMAGKSFTEANVKQLLTEGHTDTIRGFKSKAGKKFDAVVTFAKDEEGKITGLKFDFDNVKPVTLADVKCPKCGGEIVVNQWGYSCINNTREQEKATCDFHIGKIASVMLKQDQVKELLIRKKLGEIEGFVGKNGMMFNAPLRLTEDGKVEFDFPEKPKPVASNVPCPKCGKLMQKSQWQYECECGTKFWHTIGKKGLSEKLILEILENKRTKAKIVGFESKAGNIFDSVLKWDEETSQIRFDFDAPGDGYMNELGEPVELKPVEKEVGAMDFGAISADEIAQIAGEADPQEAENPIADA